MPNFFVYADNAATTPLSKVAFSAMQPFLTENYGNASSIYSVGRESRHAIDRSRELVAKAIGADPAEIFFTSGGSESDNWAITGTAFSKMKKGKHIISSKIEHHAIEHTLEYLKKTFGFEITYLDVDGFGLVDPKALRRAMTDETVLVTMMFANNEIGTIEPIKELCAVAKERNVLFHTDAVQAVGHVPIDVKDLDIDMLSMSAHKFNGPKGVGALYIKRGVNIDPYMHGGAQEFGKRASTENVAGIVGMGVAIDMAVSSLENNSRKIKMLRDHLIDGLKTIPYSRLNGHPELRLDNNVNMSFEFIEGESLLLMLDAAGICASTGSACTSGSLDPSHVLLAIGLRHEVAHGSLRLSVSESNTIDEMDYVIEKVKQAVSSLREMSPLYEGMQSKG